MTAEDQYLIWSNEHKAWWGPGRAGYSHRLKRAGRYSREEALAICFEAMAGRRGNAPFPEIPIPATDVEWMMQTFKGVYPGYDPEPKEY